MRISDWSSDVCSSDLGGRFRLPFPSSHDVGAARGPPPGTTRNTPQPRSFEMDPVVTIIVTPRDRYSGLDECIDSVYRHTQEPFRLWILDLRSEEHTSELQSLMRISYAVFCLKKK